MLKASCDISIGAVNTCNRTHAEIRVKTHAGGPSKVLLQIGDDEYEVDARALTFAVDSCVAPHHLDVTA